MKKTSRLLAVLLVAMGALAIAAGLYVLADESSDIKAEIEKANYCEVVDDCVQLNSKCPFDCYEFVNTVEAERIQALIDGYESTCVYSCVQFRGVDCIDNKCVVEIDGP